MVERYEGVTASFTQQFEELYATAYRSAFVLLGDRADAEDCAQEALARALVRWRKVESYAVAWVARVSSNLALDRLRRNMRHRPAERSRSSADPMRERRFDLVVALRSLPSRQREAVVLRYVLDRPEAEVAAAMGCTVGTVKSAASRGLDGLRAHLGETWMLEA